jgi:hypothetical protein
VRQHQRVESPVIDRHRGVGVGVLAA